MKKAYFIDLDNTIYFTKPNVNLLLKPLYDFLEQQDLGVDKEQFDQAKEEMLRIPFQKIAKKYHFKADASRNAVEFLKDRELTVPMDVHHEYHYLKALAGLKMIVTSGFEKTQLSKINMLGIRDDFDDIYIVDNSKSDETKKEAFETLLKKHKLSPNEVLVIGDDADSEIRFGLELGMETFPFRSRKHISSGRNYPSLCFAKRCCTDLKHKMLQKLSYLNLILAILYALIYLRSGTFNSVSGVLMIIIFSWLGLRSFEFEQYKWKIWHYLTGLWSLYFVATVIYSAINILSTVFEFGFLANDTLYFLVINFTFIVSFLVYFMFYFLRNLKGE